MNAAIYSPSGASAGVGFAVPVDTVNRVVPELIQSDFTAAKVASRVEYLLDHPQAREEMAQELRALKGHLGSGGAIRRAADAVAGVFQSGGVTGRTS